MVHTSLMEVHGLPPPAFRSRPELRSAYIRPTTIENNTSIAQSSSQCQDTSSPFRCMSEQSRLCASGDYASDRKHTDARLLTVAAGDMAMVCNAKRLPCEISDSL